MANTLTASVEASLATGGINYIDLVRIKLSPTETLYWSSRTVPESLTGDGIIYDARIKSMSALPFKAGFDDSTINLTFANHDGIVRDKANMGMLWEQAEVSVCRLFPALDPPDNQVGTWANPYWWGWIKQAPTFEPTSTMKISSGILELSREALRRNQRTCPAILGSEHFPYNPLNGKGLPQNKVSGTATGGSATTLTTSDTISEIEESWLIFVKTKKIIGRVASVSGTTITVDDWFYGGATTELIPANGESWICGPEYTEYDGTQEQCMNMGMFGPSTQQDADDDLNTDTRRYFYAVTVPGNAWLQLGAPIQSLATSLYSSVEGEGTDGKVIPVRIGKFEGDLDLHAWGVTNDGYIHTVGTVGEGRCKVLQAPRLDGAYYVDEDAKADPSYRNPWIEGGTDYFSDSNDSSAVTSGELTLSQKNQCIGSRQSRARGSKPNEVLDTYANNPYGFNDGDGGGCSFAGQTWVRCRFKREGYTSGTPVVKIRGTGLLVHKSDDTWTEAPNSIDVAYYFLTNQLWGAGLSSDRLNTSDFTAESAVAGGSVNPQGSTDRTPTGALVAGPEDMDSDRTPPMSAVIVPSYTFSDGDTINGKSIQITASGVDHTFYINSHYEVPGVVPVMDPANNITTCDIGDTGYLLNLDGFLDDYFDAGNIPGAGDVFSLNAQEEPNTKYPANGSLIMDTSVGKMMDEILKNANATYILKNGKISPVIRDEVSLDTVNARRTYADHGPNRNVVYRNGESTFKFTPADSSKIPTSVRVEFVDINQGFMKRQITIRNTFAEGRVKQITGQDARNKKVAVLSLCLTGSVERAVRLGAMYLNENSFLKAVPNYHPGEFTLEVPIHDAQDVVPVEDVYPISGKDFPEWAQYMRVTEVVDNSDKGTVTMTGVPYFPEMYANNGGDFILVPGPAITTPTGGEAQPLVIYSLTEGASRDDEGTLKVTVTVEITLP